MSGSVARICLREGAGHCKRVAMLSYTVSVGSSLESPGTRRPRATVIGHLLQRISKSRRRATRMRPTDGSSPCSTGALIVDLQGLFW